MPAAGVNSKTSGRKKLNNTDNQGLAFDDGDSTDTEAETEAKPPKSPKRACKRAGQKKWTAQLSERLCGLRVSRALPVQPLSSWDLPVAQVQTRTLCLRTVRIGYA